MRILLFFALLLIGACEKDYIVRPDLVEIVRETCRNDPDFADEELGNLSEDQCYMLVAYNTLDVQQFANAAYNISKGKYG